MRMRKYGFHQKRNKKSPALRRVGLFSTLHKRQAHGERSSAWAWARSGADEGAIASRDTTYCTKNIFSMIRPAARRGLKLLLRSTGRFAPYFKPPRASFPPTECGEYEEARPTRQARTAHRQPSYRRRPLHPVEKKICS